jgi:hypothetical protein
MTSMADQAAVKEYIAKYQLEDELSAAVNMAIKQNSDNPFKVISDYLKTLANDDEEEEDDDDVMDEAEEELMPVTKPRGRRAQVMAAKVDIPADFKPPVYPKSPEVEAWLAEVMDENKLMKMLSPSDRKQLMQALKEVSFKPGDTIIKQGDPGDNFYILDKGAPPLLPSPAGVPRRSSYHASPTQATRRQPFPRLTGRRLTSRRVRHQHWRQGVGDEGQEGGRLRRARAAAQRAARGHRDGGGGRARTLPPSPVPGQVGGRARPAGGRQKPARSAGPQRAPSHAGR